MMTHSYELYLPANYESGILIFPHTAQVLSEVAGFYKISASNYVLGLFGQLVPVLCEPWSASSSHN